MFEKYFETELEYCCEAQEKCVNEELDDRTRITGDER